MFPVYSPNDTGVYRFLFGTDVCEPQTLQAKSSLQRNVRDHLIGGGKIKVGGGFVLREDLNMSLGYYKRNFKY